MVGYVLFTFAVLPPLPCGLTFAPKSPRPLRPFPTPSDPRARSRQAPGNRKLPPPGVWPFSMRAPPGGALALCIVGTVVRFEPASYTSRDAACTQPLAGSAPPGPQPGFPGRDAAFWRVSCFSPGTEAEAGGTWGGASRAG